jgi:hypothetical protein
MASSASSEQTRTTVPPEIHRHGLLIQLGEGRDLREPLQNVDRAEIHVLRAADVTPRIHRESTHDHEAHFRRGQPVEQLPQAQLGGHRRAAPRNFERNSLRAIPSARFTASERRPCSRRRRCRTSSFSCQGSTSHVAGWSEGRERPTARTVRRPAAPRHGAAEENYRSRARLLSLHVRGWPYGQAGPGRAESDGRRTRRRRGPRRSARP